MTPTTTTTAPPPDRSSLAPPTCEQVDPTNPQALIESALYWYPSLFENRTDVLAHLLFTNGNGYAWDGDGCLVSCYRDMPEDRRRPDPDDDSDLDHERYAGLPDLVATLRAERHARRTHEARIRTEYQDRARTTGPVKATGTRPEGLDDWMLATRPPVTIHPAWKTVLDEALALFAAGWATQDAAEQARFAELNDLGRPALAHLMHQVLDTEYTNLVITPAEYNAARTHLEQHAPATRDRTDIDQARASSVKIREIADALLAQVRQPATPKDDAATRTLEETFALLMKRLHQSARFYGPRPVPNLRYTDDMWLLENWRTLLQP